MSDCYLKRLECIVGITLMLRDYNCCKRRIFVLIPVSVNVIKRPLRDACLCI